MDGSKLPLRTLNIIEWGFGESPHKDALNLLHVRASALPRILSCHPSSKIPDLKIDRDSEDSKIGTATHDVLRFVKENSLASIPDVIPFAQKAGTKSYSDVAFLARRGLTCLTDDLAYIDFRYVEESIWILMDGGVHLTGTPDLVGLAMVKGKKTLVIVDYKTGSDEVDPVDQLKGYGLMYLNAFEGIEMVRVVTCYLRLPEDGIDTRDFTLEEISQHGLDTIGAMQDENGEYNDKESNCRYCPLAHDCPAHLARGREYSRFFLKVKQPARVRTKTIAQMIEMVSVLEKKIKAFNEYKKNYLIQHGQIDLDDDRILKLVEESRETIYMDASARSYLCGKFDLNQNELNKFLDGLVTIKKDALLKVVKAIAAHGEKTEFANSVLDGLRDCGCVVNKSFLKSKSMKKEIIDGTTTLTG